jgi:hypothetical protein
MYVCERVRKCVYYKMICMRVRVCTQTHTHTHVQHGKTSLWLACYKKDEEVAAVLMEASKRAGALDLQVTKKACLGVWGVRCG